MDASAADALEALRRIAELPDATETEMLRYRLAQCRMADHVWPKGSEGKSRTCLRCGMIEKY